MRFERAVERRRASQAADADLAYQATVVTSAEMPRVTRQFDRLTWQGQIQSLVAYGRRDVRHLCAVPSNPDNVQAGDAAIELL